MAKNRTKIRRHKDVRKLVLICLCMSLITATLSACGHAQTENHPGGVGASREEYRGSEGLQIEYKDNGYYVTGVGSCIDLEINIPAKYDGKPVAGIYRNAFKNAGWITRVNIPKGATTIYSEAFFGCNSLAVVSIPATVMTVYPNAFPGCDSLHVVYYGGKASDWKRVYLPSGGFDTLADAMVIPASGEAYNVSKGLDISEDPDGNCTVKGIGSCTDSVVRIPPVYNGHPVTRIGKKAFYFKDWASKDSVAKRITRLEIPEGVTEIERDSIAWLVNLTAVTLPSTLEDIDPKAFDGCQSLATVYYNGGATFFRKRLAIHNVYLLSAALVTPNLGSQGLFLFDDSDICTVANVARCDKDVVISIPAEYNGHCVFNIMDGAFEGLSELRRVDIADNFYRFNCIGEAAFKNCSNLTVVSLPAHLVKIEEDAFSGCASLTTVYFGGSEADWQKIRIDSGNDSLTNATIIFKK